MWQTLREEKSTDAVSIQRTMREKHAPFYYYIGCTKRRQFHSIPAMNIVNAKNLSAEPCLHGSILCATALMGKHAGEAEVHSENQSGSHRIWEQLEIHSTARMKAEIKHLRVIMEENHGVYNSSKKRTYFKKQTKFLHISSGKKISTD